MFFLRRRSGPQQNTHPTKENAPRRDQRPVDAIEHRAGADDGGRDAGRREGRRGGGRSSGSGSSPSSSSSSSSSAAAAAGERRRGRGLGGQVCPHGPLEPLDLVRGPSLGVESGGGTSERGGRGRAGRRQGGRSAAAAGDVAELLPLVAAGLGKPPERPADLGPPVAPPGDQRTQASDFL